jgi:CRISPR/Cas system endoribonuclease Cas6 (RAMP superfamily)
MDIQQKTKHWKNIFERQQSGGLSIVQFCRDNKINISTFYAWRKRLISQTKKTQPQQIIPFVINEQPFSQSSMIKLTTPTGYQVDFDSTLAHQVLAQLLKLL